MPEPTFIRLDDRLAAQLDTLATLTDRPTTWHIEQAIRAYIAREMEFLESVEGGIRADDAGDVVTHAEVEAVMEEHRRRYPVREP